MLSSILILALSAVASAHPKPVSYGCNGAVASESEVCSQIGISELKSGGNAADAVSFGKIFPESIGELLVKLMPWFSSLPSNSAWEWLGCIIPALVGVDL